MAYAMNVTSESYESTRLAAPCLGRGVYAVSLRVRWYENVEWKPAQVGHLWPGHKSKGQRTPGKLGWSHGFYWMLLFWFLFALPPLPLFVSPL